MDIMSKDFNFGVIVGTVELINTMLPSEKYLCVDFPDDSDFRFRLCSGNKEILDGYDDFDFLDKIKTFFIGINYVI